MTPAPWGEGDYFEWLRNELREGRVSVDQLLYAFEHERKTSRSMIEALDEVNTERLRWMAIANGEVEP